MSLLVDCWQHSCRPLPFRSTFMNMSTTRIFPLSRVVEHQYQNHIKISIHQLPWPLSRRLRQRSHCSCWLRCLRLLRLRKLSLGQDSERLRGYSDKCTTCVVQVGGSGPFYNRGRRIVVFRLIDTFFFPRPQVLSFLLHLSIDLLGYPSQGH